ncbi:MAG TPA: glycosyltransferase family 87 protein [Candidatus Binatia bacterium]
MADRKTLAALVACAGAIAIVSLRVWTHLNVPGDPHAPRYALQDFRDAVYYPVRAFVDGVNPYDQPRVAAAYPVADGLGLYPPLTLLMHAPLAFLPYRAAELAYFAGEVVLTIALGCLALALCGVRPTVARVAGMGAALVASRPGHWNLFNGQVTLQVLLPTLVALWYVRERPLVSAVALAVAALKPTYGLPLAALLLARGGWRPVLLGGALALALTLAATVRLVAASDGVRPLVASIQASYTARVGEPRKQPEHSPFRVDVVALVARLLGRTPGNAETMALTLATLGVAALGLRRLTRREAQADAPGEPRGDGARAARVHAAGLAGLAIVACCYHQQYDLPVLAVPLAALVWCGDAWPWRQAPGLCRLALMLVLVPLANYLASETAVGMLGLSPSALLAASSVDNVALLGLLGVYVALA